jgi:hypothetical protein
MHQGRSDDGVHFRPATRRACSAKGREGDDWGDMTDLGYLVVRRGIDNRTPFAVGDDVVTYKLAEPWPYATLPPHSGHDVELQQYSEAVLRHANDGDVWRIHSVLRCDCGKGASTLAQVLVHGPSARLWVTMARQEFVPAALRNGQQPREGWPLHGRPGEAPHVGEVASCKCGNRWLVVSFTDRAETLRIDQARHGAKISP